MLIEKKLVIDISKNSKEIQYVVQQYETGSRGVAIYFTKNKRDFPIPAEYTAYGQIEKPGGSQHYIELERRGDAIILPFSREMTDKIGKLRCKIICVNKSGDILLSSPVLYFGILGGLANPNPYLVNDSEYNLFAEAVKTLHQLIDKSDLANIEFWAAIEKLNEINGLIDDMDGVANALVTLNQETARLEQVKADRKELDGAVKKIDEDLEELIKVKADKAAVAESFEEMATALETAVKDLNAGLLAEMGKLGALAYQDTAGAAEITSLDPAVIMQNEDYRLVSDEQISGFQDKYSRIEIENLVSELTQGLDWKESVATFAAIADTYPSPEDGWTVNVKDDNITYRFNGEEWVAISANIIPLATDEVDGLISAEDYIKLSKVAEEANKTILYAGLDAGQEGQALDATMGKALKGLLEEVHNRLEGEIQNLNAVKAEKEDLQSGIAGMTATVHTLKEELTETINGEIQQLKTLAYQDMVAADQIVSVNPAVIAQDEGHRLLTDEQMKGLADKYTAAETDTLLSGKADAQDVRQLQDELKEKAGQADLETLKSLTESKADLGLLAEYPTKAEVTSAIGEITGLKNATLIEDWDFVASEVFADMVPGEIRGIYSGLNDGNMPWNNSSKGFIMRGPTATDYNIVLFRAGRVTDIVTRSCYQDVWTEWDYLVKTSDMKALENRVAALEKG